MDTRPKRWPSSTSSSARAIPRWFPPLLNGILDKYLPEGERSTGGAKPEDTLNAFGFESLTLIEVILDLQDAMGISLSDDELRGLHGMDEVRAVLARKVAALRGPS